MSDCPGNSPRSPGARNCHRRRRGRHGFNILRNAVGFAAGVDDEFACRLQIGASAVETPLDLGRKAALDLDSPQVAVRPFQQQVDFGPAATPVKMAENPIRRVTKQILDNEPFPARADDRMAQQGFPVGNVQQRMNQARIADVDFG